MDSEDRTESATQNGGGLVGPIGVVSSSKAVDKSTLARALEVCDEAHVDFSHLLSMLESRLEPLLRPIGPDSDAKTSAEQPPVSDITQAVQEKTAKVRNYARRINGLLERLEV